LLVELHCRGGATVIRVPVGKDEPVVGVSRVGALVGRLARGRTEHLNRILSGRAAGEFLHAISTDRAVIAHCGARRLYRPGYDAPRTVADPRRRLGRSRAVI
jgi:hypothetical protein